jgi:hypothetical protein
VEVLGKTGFDGAFGAVFEHQAGHFMVLGQNLVVGETEHRLAAALTGLDLELAPRTGPDDEVLQQAAGGNAGFQLGIGLWIGMPADIARRRDELALIMALTPECEPGASTIDAHVAQRVKAPSPLTFLVPASAIGA